MSRLSPGVHLRTLAAALIALSGCCYQFQNPVSTQDAGEVTGTLQLVGGAPGQTPAGSTVDLLWSNLSLTLDSSGRFTFLDLADGTYTLRYRVPGNPAAVGERLDLYLPPTSGGPDTIALGTIDVDLGALVEGNVQGEDAGIVVAAFAPDADGGFGEFEGYATTTDPAGHYQLLLPAGKHELWASNAQQSAPLMVDAVAGADQTGQDFVAFNDLSLASGPSVLEGYAVLGSLGASASEAQVQAIVPDGGIAIGLRPEACPSCTLETAFQTPAPAAGVTALQLYQPLTPGQLYDVEVAMTVPTAPAIPPVYLTGIPAIAGRTTLLRQIFLLSQDQLAANGATPVDGGNFFATDGGPADGGSTDGGPVDAGTIDWSLLGEVAYDGGVASAVLLPDPTSPEATLFAWQTAATIDAAQILGDGGSPAPPSIVAQDSTSAFPVVGAVATGDFLEWAAMGANGYVLEDATQGSPTGGWPSGQAALLPVNLISLALASDPNGTLWSIWATSAPDAGLFAQNDAGVQRMLPLAVPAKPVLSASSCAPGVCVGFCDSNGAAEVGILSGGQAWSEVGLGDGGCAGEALTGLSDGTVLVAWTDGAGVLQWAQLSAATGAVGSSGNLGPGSLPTVLAWRKGAVVVYESAQSGLWAAPVAGAAGQPRPLFPPGLGPVLGGTVDSANRLVVAVAPQPGARIPLLVLPP
jgi:hypothetical protein